MRHSMVVGSGGRSTSEGANMGGDYRQHAGAVYERDDWTCKLCGLPVAKDRSAPHPLAPSLDHIKPQSLAGSDPRLPRGRRYW